MSFFKKLLGKKEVNKKSEKPKTSKPLDNKKSSVSTKNKNLSIDNRTFFRVKCDTLIQYKDRLNNETFAGQLLDLSAGGAALQTRYEHKTGLKILMDLNINDSFRFKELHATIMRIKESKESTENEKLYILGLKFQGLTEIEQKEFVKKLNILIRKQRSGKF